MLKKTGVVLAASMAGVLVMSPLAFAHDGGGHRHHDHGHSGSGGLLNVSDIGVGVPVQLCNNSILSGVLGILSGGNSNNDSHNGKCSQSNDH